MSIHDLWIQWTLVKVLVKAGVVDEFFANQTYNIWNRELQIHLKMTRRKY